MTDIYIVHQSTSHGGFFVWTHYFTTEESAKRYIDTGYPTSTRNPDYMINDVANRIVDISQCKYATIEDTYYYIQRVRLQEPSSPDSKQTMWIVVQDIEGTGPRVWGSCFCHKDGAELEVDGDLAELMGYDITPENKHDCVHYLRGIRDNSWRGSYTFNIQSVSKTD